jgi:hypothetical protein
MCAFLEGVEDRLDDLTDDEYSPDIIWFRRQARKMLASVRFEPKK